MPFLPRSPAENGLEIYRSCRKKRMLSALSTVTPLLSCQSALPQALSLYVSLGLFSGPVTPRQKHGTILVF